MKALLALAAAAVLAKPASTLGTRKALPESVARVVKLLQDLKGRVEADGEEEQKAFDKYACWCEKVTQRKANAITEVQHEMRVFADNILQLKGTVATNIAEIKELTEDLHKNEVSQKTATEIRQKENSEFLAEKAELQKATAALESAIHVLRDAASVAALQRPETSAAVARAHAAVLKLPAAVRPSERHLAALAKASQNYAPQSATIIGILQDMYKNFALNLETRTKDEATAHKNYEDLIATWQTEAITLRESLTKKEQYKAEAETMLAAVTKGYADDEAQIKADIAYFDATKAACVEKVEEWSSRKSLRSEELSGITKALEILTETGEASLVQKVAPSFLQVSGSSATSAEQALSSAQGALERSARATQSLRLASLAATLSEEGRSASVGHFAAVIEAIDGMLATIQEEGKEDDRKAAACTNQYQEIASASKALEWKVAKNDAKLQKLAQLISAAESEKEVTDEDIAAVEKDMADAEAQRTADNGEYLKKKGEDEEAIKLLRDASAALGEYYAQHSGAAAAGLVQKTKAWLGQHEEPAPETKFADEGKRKNEAGGILALLAHITEDLENGVAKDTKAEEAAQLDFEARQEAAKALKERLLTKKANLEETIASRNLEVTKVEGLKSDNEAQLATQTKTKEDITPDCDATIANLPERRKKRDIESEGLRTAKSYLAGQQSLVQVQRFDDTAFPRLTFEAVSFLQRRSRRRGIV